MNKTKRQIARENAMVGIYQNLLVETSLEDLTLYLSEDETLKESESSFEFALWLVQTTLENKDDFQQEIEKHLKKSWSFERLSYMERAILLVATCEIKMSELPKTVIVNEAVLNAKTFCDQESYKFINGILSKVE